MSEPSKSSRRNRRRATRRRMLLGTVVVLLIAAGAGIWYVLANRVDTDALMTDARSSFESGEYIAAVINLKNVLGKEPSNREARLLLGRAYLAAGDPAGAAKELARARELGESGDTLNRELTRALILSGMNVRGLPFSTNTVRRLSSPSSSVLILPRKFGFVPSSMMVTFSGAMRSPTWSA